MKKFFIALMVAVCAMSMTVSNADAKRLGGGSSIGKQSQSVGRQSNQAANTAKPAAPQAPAAAPGAAVPPKPASPWKGILGGALLGLGLGALFSHFGLSGAVGSMIGMMLMIALIGFAVMFVVRMLRKGGSQPAYAGGYVPGSSPDSGARVEPVAQPSAFQAAQLSSGGNAQWGIPADFDVPAFLRNSKTYFIRLQAAWDKADINDIREFTTPEMYAELKLQIQERGSTPNTTDVVSLDAEMLGIETVGNEYLASVKFSGMIKDAANASAEPFTEVWNLSKPVSGQGGWILAGIQQVS